MLRLEFDRGTLLVVAAAGDLPPDSRCPAAFSTGGTGSEGSAAEGEEVRAASCA